MNESVSKDVWDSGESYEHYVGRWSRAVAGRFIEWLDLPPGLSWVDVGCGTGALTASVLDSAAPAEIVGIDQSEGYIERARRQVADSAARFEPGDAQDLPFDNARFDAVVSGLMLNFVPDQARAAAEMRRVVRAGGTAAVYVWDYAGEMQLMRRFWDAAAALDPAAAALDEGRRFPVCRPDALQRLFRDAGFDAVETCAIDVPTVFADFDDYWTPFLGGQGPAPGYCVSLAEDRREALRRRLVETVPAAADGTISLIARAWAVKGRAAA